MFDSVSDMSTPDAADVLREICQCRPTVKMGARPGMPGWNPITFVHGVDVSDLVDALTAEGLVMDTLHRGLQVTERGQAVLERLGPDGRLDLPLPPDVIAE